MIGAHDRDLAGLQRLAQRIEHLRLEFRQLVEKQHAVMGERDFARPRMQAAADQGRHAGGMMRRPERPPVGQCAAFDHAGDRLHHGDFEKLGRRQRRQDRGQPRRQHRLAGAGRPDHEQIMAAGGRHFERALGAFLALDVGKIGEPAGGFQDLRLRPRQHLRALEVVGELDQRGGRDDLDLRARPGRLGSAFGRADQAFATRIGADRRRQHARHRCDRAVEAELAQDRKAGQRVMRNGADRGHQAERDRQIVVAAFLGQIGRRQIDGDAAGRQRQPRGDHCRAHPLARLRHRLVGQADDGESRHAGCDLHLHIDGPDLDALERDRGDPLDHVRPRLRGRVAELFWRVKNI